MNQRTSVKSKLAVMNFLEFAIWGTYLTCIGNYLGSNGLGGEISLFYAVQGVVSIFMPAIMGILADKFIQPQRLLGLCHLAAALFMGLAWHYGYTHPGNIEFGTIFTLYTISVAFFMPTIALANTVAFSTLRRHGMDTVSDFPPIRVLGTVGFIAAMWFVNGFYIYDGHWDTCYPIRSETLLNSTRDSSIRSISLHYAPSSDCVSLSTVSSSPPARS